MDNSINQFWNEVDAKHKKAKKKERKNKRLELDELENENEFEEKVLPKKKKSAPSLTIEDLKSIVQAEFEVLKESLLQEVKGIIALENRFSQTNLYRGIRNKIYKDIMNELDLIKTNQSYAERKLEAVLEGTK